MIEDKMLTTEREGRQQMWVFYYKVTFVLCKLAYSIIFSKSLSQYYKYNKTYL